ncbi:MAG: DUF4126 domain-containing protein [Thermodesulfobacteriota bacterium]
MEQLHSVTQLIALTLGSAWASGINLYATILVLGVLGSRGDLVLPAGLAILTHPPVIVAAGFMYLVEFFVDKTPGVDTGWDTIHTFVRIPMGAALAAGAVWHLDPAVGLAAAIVGGGLATTSHATKAGSRVLINTSPEPFTNWAASLVEDLAVVAGLWTALHHPGLFLALLVLCLLCMAWLLPRLWRGVQKVLGTIAAFFGRRAPPPASPPPAPMGDGI